MFDLKLDGMVIEKQQSTKTNGKVEGKWEEMTIILLHAQMCAPQLRRVFGYESLPRLIERIPTWKWNNSEARLAVYCLLNFSFLELSILQSVFYS